jgi:hypothetical protein
MAGRALGAGVLLLAACLAATRIGLRPPDAAPATAPPEAFSAERALVRLRAVIDSSGGVPHPAGSEAGRRVQERVVAELRSLGLSPQVYKTFACGSYLACVDVANVVARVPGRGGASPVLLSVHHDSVPAGPGAADDASGVAIALEVARALKADPAASDVLLLVDDGEESGLVGAEAFLAGPEALEVRAIVNVEARGTSGPSLLFETTGPGSEVVRAFARGAHRPMGSSLFSTVYALLPNDTDLTVLRRLGVPGANLAFIGGAARYHTPLDDLAHLDGRSLQHQGENALALVRGLAAADAVARQRRVVWFDVLGRTVVAFPERAALPLALAALALSALLAGAAVRRRLTTATGVALGALAPPACILLAALLGQAAGRVTGLDPVLRPWVATPTPLVAGFLLAGVAAAALPAALLGRAGGEEGFRHGIRIALAAFATALAATFPGASFLLLVPAVTAAAAGLTGGGPRAGRLGDLVTLVAACLVLLPPAWLLEPALGHAAGGAVAVAMALAALPLAPLVAALPARGRAAAVAVPVLAGTLALCVAGSIPPTDAGSPARIVLYFHQDAETGEARLLASPDTGRLPSRLRAAAPFGDAAGIALPWGALRPSFVTPVAPLAAPGPAAEILQVVREGGVVRARLRLSSPRGAPELQLVVPPQARVQSFSVDGTEVPPPVAKLARWFGGHAVHRFPARPGGTEVSLRVEGAPPLEVVIADSSPGLPASAREVVHARDEVAVPVQEGDVTLLTRRLRLEPEP